MRRNLVNERQAFGSVMDSKNFMSMNGPAGMSAKPLGGETMRGNNGLDHGPSFGDKNPNAYEQACVGRENPFMWTQKPKRSV